jgi:hypothetical protein
MPKMVMAAPVLVLKSFVVMAGLKVVSSVILVKHPPRRQQCRLYGIMPFLLKIVMSFVNILFVVME